MKNHNYMKKFLHDLYEADKVFAQILQKSIKKADPMPRIKKAANQLLQEASTQVENIENQLSLIGQVEKPVFRMKSYEV